MDLTTEDFDCEVLKEKKIKNSTALKAIEQFVEVNRPGAHGLSAKDHDRLCNLVAALKEERAK